MEKRKLGNSKLYVNPVGLGCMGFSHGYGAPMEKGAAVRTLREACEIGYDFLDTAEAYYGTNPDGTISYNEELVGEAVKGIRDKVVIATKMGVSHNADRSLGTDSSPETVAETMAELIKEGKIRYWGISEVTEEYLRRANDVCPVTAVQNRYSMMARWHETIFPVCEELNVAYVAFSPMANGFLTGKYTPGTKI